LLLVWLERTNYCLHIAVDHVLRTLRHVLADTLAYARQSNDPHNCANLELRLIQCKSVILAPPAFDLHVVQL
jgi:hypothetical protein